MEKSWIEEKNYFMTNDNYTDSAQSNHKILDKGRISHKQFDWLILVPYLFELMFEQA